MVGLAVPSTHFCPLDPKYLFFDASRVLDGPPGSSKFPRDHYIMGGTKFQINIKNHFSILCHLNSSVGRAMDCRMKGPRIKSQSCQLFRDIAVLFKCVQN